MKGHYSNILVPTDFSEQSLLALEQAYALAKLLNVEVTLLHVIAEGGVAFNIPWFSKDSSEKDSGAYEESCYARLLQISESASKNSWIKVNPLMLKGKVHEQITQTAKDIYARFIVMATDSSDPEHKKNSIGSVTSHVLGEAPCPVLTFNGTNIREQFDTIVLPLDLTKETQQKVTKAIEVAKFYNSTIRVVSVLLTGEKEIFDHLTEQLKEVKEYIEKRDIYTTTNIIRGSKAVGSIVDYVLDYAYETDGDLIVIMIQQDVGWKERFLGSMSSDFIRHSKIPVMSVIAK
jgi:nucleotide-binding universal stress UspA family protein